MLSRSSFLSHSMRGLGGFVLALSALSFAQAQDATAPTASQEPVTIDQLWQKASSKYDAERAALLKEVDTM
jgi:hypothetical protein